ncbi:hypothetical protein VHEMI01482 [[Torrubiella] hemipterigena]|uniref:Uncharacterized protein n=1 Tax=[Torrubiella] hemipterigena TaxID=1531966 RepID=A0A0A1T7L4_9HYPO|nr:hypothetical protein VHEMI01482 [[Torrubiella] hemipterigena]
MREILTLQLGHLGNYTATHFWNTQESYFTYEDGQAPLVEHDVHWRAGLGQDGSETFLPRTVIYDLKGGFGSLRKINALYDATSDGDEADSALWTGQPIVHKANPVEPIEYQKSLETGAQAPKLTTSSVRYWSDFSRVYFHPKSLVQLYDYELHSTVMPFERYSMGKELYSSLDKDHDILDRDWRPFVEECDRMEGVQVFTSLDDAWGGFAASYIEAIRDEYGKAPIWTWGLQSPLAGVSRDKRMLRVNNVGQGIAELNSCDATIIPLSVPESKLRGVHVDTSSNWHYSALLATAIESATLPSRLLQISSIKPIALDDLTASLNTTGRQHIAAMTLGVGERNDDDKDLELFSIGNDRRETKGASARWFGHVECVRDEQKQDDKDEEENKRNIIGEQVNRNYHTVLEFPLMDSFPTIYTDYDGKAKIPARSSLYTDQSISKHMKNLRTQLAWGIGLDDKEDLVNSIAEISEAYQDDWDSGSDEGDDDI